MNFITVGDQEFVKPLSWSISQVNRHHPSAELYLYDWGLSSETSNSFDVKPNVNVVNWRQESSLDLSSREETQLAIESRLRENKYTNYLLQHVLDYSYPVLTTKNEFLYSQKPYCIRDCASRVDRNLVFLDGDAILANDIAELQDRNFDIGVTLRPQEEIQAAQEKDNFHVLNAGVIYFFCESSKIRLFVDEWIQRMNSLDCELYEQTALTQLVAEAGDAMFKSYNQSGSIVLGGEK
jgi:hypothetical protein